ncbi:protein phosphatase 1 regulatory subunit 12C-like [Mytilus galloprovincialis]|uniref:protein phosphatase 1 regulatory subunit 12C-like n=1 Tax=Mytilus galloprovincialis TaxID=29158 RepID=UPI003F7BF3BE
MTAFMFASREGHLEVTRLLLESNCEKDITDRGGRTALHLAAQYGHELVTKYLVEHGMFSPLVKTHQGKTPYDLANELKLGQYSEVMKYLKIILAGPELMISMNTWIVKPVVNFTYSDLMLQFFLN